MSNNCPIFNNFPKLANQRKKQANVCKRAFIFPSSLQTFGQNLAFEKLAAAPANPIWQ
jgi:hypothetical protein